MPPAVTRELSITYAGYVVGGTQTNRLLDAATGRFRLTRTYERSNVTFTVMITGSTEAAYAAECAAFEAAFRTPRGALTITLGSNNLLAVSHTGNTGYNASPTVNKTGTRADTGRSRRYEVSIDFSEPADLSGQSGRRSSTVDRSYDSSRKATVTITGVYTALAANGAQAQYDSAAETYFAAVLSGFGGTYEKVSEQTGRDDADKELNFTVVYREVIYNQAIGTLNHAGIVEPRLSIKYSRSSPGDSPEGSARRLRTVVATFETSVDKTVVSDLATLYSGTIKPFIIQQAKLIANGLVAQVNEDYDLNGSDYQIRATITYLAVGASDVTEYEMTCQLEETLGRRIVPVWGNTPYEAHVIPNPGVRRRIVTERAIFIANSRLLDARGPAPMDVLQLGSTFGKVYPFDGMNHQWVTLKGTMNETQRTIGEDETFDLVERTSTFEQQWVDLPTGGTTNVPT